jgi:hypothetical protein
MGFKSQLRVWFQDAGLRLMPEIQEMHDIEQLRAIPKALGAASKNR